MAALLARRLMQAVAILLGVAVITFLLLHYLPADPAALVAGRSANAQMIANVRHQLGLDLPLPLQFWRYLTGLARGDLGRSYIQRSEVATLPRDARYDDSSAMLNADDVLASAARVVSDEEFLADITWGFYYDDVDVQAASRGRWISDGYLQAIVAYVCTPGVIASEAAAITVPVLVAAGERDSVADPRGEPRAYLSSPSVDLFLCPRMAHMHNFAGTREVFWQRIGTWADWVCAHRTWRNSVRTG